MATRFTTLKDGLKVGDKKLTKVELREVTAGDVIEAEEESEKVVMTPEGPRLLLSPIMNGLNLLRRQVVCIGDVKGPVSVDELKKLSKRDLDILFAEAGLLEKATAAAVKAETGTGGGDEPGR